MARLRASSLKTVWNLQTSVDNFSQREFTDILIVPSIILSRPSNASSSMHQDTGSRTLRQGTCTNGWRPIDFTTGRHITWIDWIYYAGCAGFATVYTNSAADFTRHGRTVIHTHVNTLVYSSKLVYLEGFFLHLLIFTIFLITFTPSSCVVLITEGHWRPFHRFHRFQNSPPRKCRMLIAWSLVRFMPNVHSYMYILHLSGRIGIRLILVFVVQTLIVDPWVLVWEDRRSEWPGIGFYLRTSLARAVSRYYLGQRTSCKAYGREISKTSRFDDHGRPEDCTTRTILWLQDTHQSDGLKKWMWQSTRHFLFLRERRHQYVLCWYADYLDICCYWR